MLLRKLDVVPSKAMDALPPLENALHTMKTCVGCASGVENVELCMKSSTPSNLTTGRPNISAPPVVRTGLNPDVPCVTEVKPRVSAPGWPTALFAHALTTLPLSVRVDVSIA